MTLTWLIWFEENPSAAPEATLKAAVQRYTEKFGMTPNHARVPLNWPEMPPNGIFIERCRHILPRHIHLALDTSLHDQNGATTIQWPDGDKEKDEN